jgi:hypothetical protein
LNRSWSFENTTFGVFVFNFYFLTFVENQNDMKVLLACEESQAVTIEFRKRGVEAYSCDILPCSGGHPEWHIQGDVLPLLKQDWDLVIAFPPCTNLAVSGARWFPEKQANGSQQRAIDFFLQI